MDKKIAVIDIGSNSIKVLVGTKDQFLFQDLKGVRIGSGMGKEKFHLSQEAMHQALNAIVEFVKRVEPYQPLEIKIFATSAVRDAQNRDEFAEAILKQTHVPLKILTGDQEAMYISYGVLTDPNLTDLDAFSLFDLGGGSLECIVFQDREVQERKSLDLGAVRLMEEYVPDPKSPIENSVLEAIGEKVRIETQDFPFLNLPLVGMGGGISVLKGLTGGSPKIKLEDIQYYCQKLASMSFEQRLSFASIPAFRADVIPVALKIISVLLQKANVTFLNHSNHNLRYGVIYDYFVE